MIDLPPSSFTLLYSTIVADPESDSLLREIGEALQLAIIYSKNARACAFAAVDILSTTNRTPALVFALTTAVCASYLEGDVEGTTKYMRRIIDLVTATTSQTSFRPQGSTKGTSLIHKIQSITRRFQAFCRP